MKKLDIHLFDLASRLLGEEAAQRLVGTVVRANLAAPRYRAALASNLRRVVGFSTGREPAPQEISALISELTDLHVRYFTEYYVLARTLAPDPSKSEPLLLPALEGLLKKGKGVILASPHFGNIISTWVALDCRGIPVTVVGNAVQGYGWSAQASRNIRLVGLGDGAVEGLAALRANGTLFLNTDVDYFPDGRTTPFFGAPFHPPQGVARMALAAGAPILPVYPVCQGGKDLILNDDPIVVDESPTRPCATQEAIEERLVRSMEKFIGKHPSHWFFFHDAWDLERSDRLFRSQLHAIWLKRRMARLLSPLNARLPRGGRLTT
ncbi:MAG: lysophospholipid acyltransferase family protein [Elusimicrobia bacterium]|nr:lysophospholipid acyltransferase family protein [Elusimicrobiota bacterium]